MRRRTLHPTTVVAVAAAVLLVAGCGTQSGGGAAGSGGASPSGAPSASPSASASASASASPSVLPSGTGCTAGAGLTAADTGHAVCLTTGGRVRVTLDGTRDRPWTTVKATGGTLRATNAGIVIQPGDAVAAFDAVAPGTARLTATRPLCAKRPGQKSCLGIQQWSVTVTVTKQWGRSP